MQCTIVWSWINNINGVYIRFTSISTSDDIAYNIFTLSIRLFLLYYSYSVYKLYFSHMPAFIDQKRGSIFVFVSWTAHILNGPNNRNHCRANKHLSMQTLHTYICIISGPIDDIFFCTPERGGPSGEYLHTLTHPYTYRTNRRHNLCGIKRLVEALIKLVVH